MRPIMVHAQQGGRPLRPTHLSLVLERLLLGGSVVDSRRARRHIACKRAGSERARIDQRHSSQIARLGSSQTPARDRPGGDLAGMLALRYTECQTRRRAIESHF